MITRKLNPQAIAIEDAQGLIKKTVTDMYFAGYSVAAIQRAVSKIIADCKKQLKTPALIETAPLSLSRLSRVIYAILIAGLGIDGAAALSRYKAAQAVSNAEIKAGKYETLETGLPTGRYSRDYSKEVARVLDRVAQQQSLDPDDISGRNSMRNKAEMETRYEDHQNEIADYLSAGVRLVMCSTHADCSDRCFPWQGRVYSLDHSTGITADGKAFVPLEEATDIFYTTKAGKVYKNGLLGFNCRHRLYEYRDGVVIPTVSAKTQKAEYKVTTRQRQLEARIRDYREKAMVFKGRDDEAAKAAQKKAMAVYKQYREYSRKHERAYYPDRTQII